MPSQNGFATTFSTTALNENNWGANDGVTGGGRYNGTVDIAMTFGTVNIPTGATIDGIEITAEGTGNPPPNKPEIFVNNGTSNSSNLSCNGSFTKSPDSTQTWGSSSQLWGLSWTSLTASQITVTVDTSTMGGATIIWDFVGITIHYTEAPSGNLVKLRSGQVQLRSGKISI
jgi:hypothetical protein